MVYVLLPINSFVKDASRKSFTRHPSETVNVVLLNSDGCDMTEYSVAIVTLLHLPMTNPDLFTQCS